MVATLPDDRIFRRSFRGFDAHPLFLVFGKLFEFDGAGNGHEMLGVLLAAVALRDVDAEVLHEALKVQVEHVLLGHLQDTKRHLEEKGKRKPVQGFLFIKKGRSGLSTWKHQFSYDH